MNSLEGIYRYCPFAKLDAAVKLGWVVVSDLPLPHGAYSMLVMWQCSCPPVWPA